MNLGLEITRGFYGNEEFNMLRRLDRKRQEIDAEITQFKNAKEQEYRDFEEKLKNDLGSKTEDSEDERRREEYEEGFPRKEDEQKAEHERPIARNNRRKHRQIKGVAALATLPDSQQEEKVNGTQTKQGGNSTSQNDPLAVLHDAASTSRSKPSPEGSPRSRSLTSASRDREKEFTGVFTPSFLPLIDNTSKSSRGNSNELLEASSSQTRPSSMALALRPNPSLIQQLSSSAEYYHNPAMTSPPAPPARPLSSSVPEEQGPGHHRSSSASGASAAMRRRSSLRNPNASEAKSPKKVLFNIDNKVVSPSTSPVAKREKENARPPKKAVMPETGQYEVVKNKPLKQPAANGASILTSSLSSASTNNWTADVSPLRWAMIGGEAKKPSPDDFVNVGDENDMFTFDEELGAEEKKSEESKVEGKFGRDPDDDDEGEAQKPLTGSSPHAGSLPIEIRWPGKREVRG